MDIQPASIAQVRQGRDGRRVTIEEDVGDVARQIHALHHSLSVQWNENGGFFSVVETDEQGTEHLVLTAQELDSRVVDRVRQIADHGYDFLSDIDGIDARAEREKEHAFHEQVGEIGEKLAHAVRKDLGHKGKVFVPKSLQ